MDASIFMQIRGWASAMASKGSNRQKDTRGGRRSPHGRRGKEAPDPAIENGTHRKLSGLTAYWLGSLLAIALILLLAFAAGIFLWLESQDANRLRQLEDVSEMIARDLGSRVATLQGRLHEWGTDPQLREALLAPSPEGLRAQEGLLTGLIRDARQVRIVKLDAGKPETLHFESLSYAGLDLVHQAAAQRKATLLEVHRLGSPEEHLAIAAPVLAAQGDTVLGVLHLALSPSFLPSLAGTVGDWGRIRLQQTVADKAVTLDFGPNGTSPAGPPDNEQPIPGTRLRAAGWLSHGEALDAALLQRVVVAYMVLMALITLAIWLPLRGLKRALAADFEQLAELAKAVTTGKPARHLRFRLAESTSVVDILTSVLNGTPPSGAPKPEAPAKSRSSSKQDAASGPDVQAATEPLLPRAEVPAKIFRAYDIRGIFNVDLTAKLMHAIGLAVGAEADEAGNQSVIVGRDTRASGKELTEALVRGLRESGRDVLDLGIVPTPLIYFATSYRGEGSGVSVTASHNPEQYNGLKIVIGGSILAGEGITALRERILSSAVPRGQGSYREGDLIGDYLSHIEKDVAIARELKVVIDCGNAAASVVAPRLFRELGCELVELDCDPDAGFPNGLVPDPTRPECLKALREQVVSHAADIGLAFDGDGDRLGVVDSSGKIIWPDRVLMLLASDVLSRHPGTDIVFDVKCSHHLSTEILRHGGRPVMWKSGHAPLKAKLQETGALLGGEWSGHIIFQDRWFGFDDALYAGARLLEVLALDPRPSAEVFAILPEAVGTPELIAPLAEGVAPQIMEAVLKQARQLEGFALQDVDGLRAESHQGWGLVRASNTQPALSFRFEADDEAELARIQDLFRDIMRHAAPDLPLPF